MGDNVNANVEILASVLRILEAEPGEQEDQLAGRGDRDEIDAAQEFADDWAEAFDAPMLGQPLPHELTGILSDLERQLLDPYLGESVDSLYVDQRWAAIRGAAAKALAYMRTTGIIPDMIPYRLYPVRFAPVLEPLIGPRAEWLAVVLTQAEFEAFEAAWECALPPNLPTTEVGSTQIFEAAQEVYASFPEIVQALEV